MNGFAHHSLDEAEFGEKKGLRENIRTFDAFRETPSLVAMSKTIKTT